MAQSAHCLKSFGILKSFAGIAPVYAVPVLRGNNGHIKDSEILVQSVKRGGSSSTSANHHGSRRFILSQISTGIKQPVQQGAEASRRSAKINWRTDDDTIRCFQFAAQHQISFILKDADAFLLAFVTTDTSLYRTIAMWTISDIIPSSLNAFATSESAVNVFPLRCGLPFTSNTFSRLSSFALSIIAKPFHRPGVIV